MTNPEFSIIMPVYNGEAHLCEAIASVQAQTFRDWELLVVDDGSSDNSRRILAAAAGNDSRVRIEVQSNCGVASARNRGLELAHGRYVTFIDQDDVLHPLALDRMVKVFAATGADAVSGRALDFLTDAGARRFCMEASTDAMALVSESPVRDVLHPVPGSQGVRASVWARGYRLSSILGLKFPDGVFGADDWVFTMRVMARVRRHAVIENVTYLHRSHLGSVSSSMPSRYILAMLGAVETVASEWCDAPDGPSIPRKEFALALSSHIQMWGLLLPCSRRRSAVELRQIAEAIARLRRKGLLPFVSCGHALRYLCVRYGLCWVVPFFWRRRFRSMAKARSNNAEMVG